MTYRQPSSHPGGDWAKAGDRMDISTGAVQAAPVTIAVRLRASRRLIRPGFRSRSPVSMNRLLPWAGSNWSTQPRQSMASGAPRTTAPPGISPTVPPVRDRTGSTRWTGGSLRAARRIRDNKTVRPGMAHSVDSSTAEKGLLGGFRQSIRGAPQGSRLPTRSIRGRESNAAGECRPERLGSRSSRGQYGWKEGVRGHFGEAAGCLDFAPSFVSSSFREPCGYDA